MTTTMRMQECPQLGMWLFLFVFRMGLSRSSGGEPNYMNLIMGCSNWETFVADTKCFWTNTETFFVPRSQNLCPQQMLRARANGETFVSATMCLQQCVRALKDTNSNAVILLTVRDISTLTKSLLSNTLICYVSLKICAKSAQPLYVPKNTLMHEKKLRFALNTCNKTKIIDVRP